MSFPLSSVFDLGAKLIDRLLPDPKQKAEAQLELLKLQQTGELAKLDEETKINLAQIEVNKAEAQMAGFRGSWRPLVGYVCVAGLAYEFLVQPLAAWLSGINHWALPPSLDMSTLLTLLAGMLGISGMRTVEKLQGKD